MRTMLPVEIMFKTSFWAVPALRRVEPVKTSGPGTGSIAKSASRPIAESALHAIAIVLHLTDRAYLSPL